MGERVLGLKLLIGEFKLVETEFLAFLRPIPCYIDATITILMFILIQKLRYSAHSEIVFMQVHFSTYTLA
jgi:hypothetical protein